LGLALGVDLAVCLCLGWKDTTGRRKKELISDFTCERLLDVPKSEFPQSPTYYFECNTFKNN